MESLKGHANLLTCQFAYLLTCQFAYLLTCWTGFAFSHSRNLKAQKRFYNLNYIRLDLSIGPSMK